MDIQVTHMPKFLFSLPMTQLVHENFSVIMAFAFSRKPLERYMERFAGEWPYLRKALFEIAEKRMALGSNLQNSIDNYFK